MPVEGRNETIMGEERENRKRSRRQRKNKNRRMTLRQKTLALLTLDTILLIAVLITGGMLMARWYREKNRPRLSELTAPEWYTQDFLQINPPRYGDTAY